jgi:hypothetical protein
MVWNRSRDLELNGLGPFIGSKQTSVGAEGGYNGEEEESEESQEVSQLPHLSRTKGLAEAGPFVFNRPRGLSAYPAVCCLSSLAELLRYRLRSRMGITHEHPRIAVTTDGCDLRHTQASLKKPADGLVSQVMKP